MNWRYNANFELLPQPNQLVKFRFDVNIHFKTFTQNVSLMCFYSSLDARVHDHQLVVQKLSAILSNNALELRSEQ